MQPSEKPGRFSLAGTKQRALDTRNKLRIPIGARALRLRHADIARDTSQNPESTHVKSYRAFTDG